MKRAGAWATGFIGIAALALSVGPVAFSISPAMAATPAPTRKRGDSVGAADRTD